MQTIQVNIINPKAYKLLQDLAALDLIALEETVEISSVKNDLTSENLSSIEKKKLFKEAFGAFESEESAEEIIAEIRGSRIFNRTNEQF